MQLFVGTSIRDTTYGQGILSEVDGKGHKPFHVRFDEEPNKIRKFTAEESASRFYLLSLQQPVQSEHQEEEDALKKKPQGRRRVPTLGALLMPAASTAKIPSWSLEDRVERASVRPKKLFVILGSNLLISSVFMCYLLIEVMAFHPAGREVQSAVICSVFIVAQLGVTFIQSMPDEDSSNVEVNQRVR